MMVEEPDSCRGGTLTGALRRLWPACAPQSARADRRCTHATRGRSRSTSRFPPDRRTACRIGRTPRIRALSESSSSHSFRLHLAGSGSLKKPVFLGLFWLEIERKAVHTVP